MYERKTNRARHEGVLGRGDLTPLILTSVLHRVERSAGGPVALTRGR
jgi:hypothetical protein